MRIQGSRDESKFPLLIYCSTPITYYIYAILATYEPHLGPLFKATCLLTSKALRYSVFGPSLYAKKNGMKPFHDPELESSKESPKKHPKDNILNITSNLKPNQVTKKNRSKKNKNKQMLRILRVLAIKSLIIVIEWNDETKERSDMGQT